jgi:hypothetical protein
MINRSGRIQSGRIEGWVVALVVLSVLFVGSSVFAGWSFYNYLDQKNNVDTKVSDAVALAKKTQAESDEAKFMERDKQPMRQFVGPDDYGRVTFDYPKTWSVYVARDAGSGGDYEAYLNPISVPTISNKQQFALRVTIDSQTYDQVVSDYDSYVADGDLKSSSVTVDGHTGTRLEGKFSNDIRGSAVLFKIRDKTLIIRTDATTFKADFDLLTNTIKFNQ